MTKRALIVVDLQLEYEAGGKLPLTGLEQAVSNARRILEAARQSGGTIIHIRHETPDASGAAPFATGTSGSQIIGDVSPLDAELTLTKHFPNAFKDTQLKASLDDAGVDEVVIVGAMSHMCIDATSRAAFDLGYGVTVIHDACATRPLSFNGVDVSSEHVHAAFMAALAFAYGRVISTSDLLSA